MNLLKKFLVSFFELKLGRLNHFVLILLMDDNAANCIFFLTEFGILAKYIALLHNYLFSRERSDLLVKIKSLPIFLHRIGD